MLSLVSRERLYRRRAGIQVERPDRFDERFADLFQEMSCQHRVTPQRTPELLNWKYELGGEGVASGAYSALAVSAEDRNVLGYVVYKTREGVCSVQDIGFVSSRSVLHTLLSELILDARRQGVEAISVIHLGPEKSLLTRAFRSFGFIRRLERAHLRVFVPEAASPEIDLRDRNNWFYLAGDTDI